MKTNISNPGDGALQTFISKLEGQVAGYLEGFDRMRLRGTLRHLYAPSVMEAYLNARRVLIKDFGNFVEKTRKLVVDATKSVAAKWNRPVVDLKGNEGSKEEIARAIAQRDGIKEGLIAVLSALEPCNAFSVVKNHQTKFIELQMRVRKCVHKYFYFEHERFGFMHVRLQTWFPYQVDICMNGRHWLARQLDEAGIAYRKRENALVWVEDFHRAQQLLDAQIRVNWCKELNGLVQQVHPMDGEIRSPLQLEYYWTFSDSEFATDLLFKRPEDLARIYPSLVHHALRSYASPDVMRFLGRSVAETGQVHSNFKGEIISDLKHRPEGVRVKHSVDGNSIKLYDKQGSVLRVETTIPKTDEFKVYRAASNHPNGPRKWRRLRRSVGDVQRRVKVSRAANHRYLKALAATNTTTPLHEWTRQVCRRVRRHGRSHRALNPLSAQDAVLLEAVNRGEWTINGFRNRDVRALLYPAKAMNKRIGRKLSERTRRQLLLLRVHGLIAKVSHTHRYIVTDKGRATITALLAARQADVTQLSQMAA